MDNHSQAARVEATAELKAVLLGARRRLRAQASDPYASQLERDISRERARPVAMILTFLGCAIRDGAPYEDVARFHRALGDWVAAQYPAPQVRPAPVLHELETMLGARLDVAQQRAVTNLGDPAADAAVVDKIDAYAPVLMELRTAHTRRIYRPQAA